MGIRQLPNGKWRLQVRRKGLPNVDRVFATKAEADAAFPDRVPSLLCRGETTLTQVWERYAESREFDTKAETTQATERCRIQPVLASLGGYSLDNLGSDLSVIEDYIDQRTKAKSVRTGHKLSPTTVRLEVAALSAVVAFAKKRKLIRVNFVKDIDRPITKKRKRRVSPMEQGKLQLAAHTFGTETTVPARFALLLRHLGCRPGELARLLKADVRLHEGDLLFRDTKNGTDRRVYTPDQAHGLLTAQLADAPEESPYVFTTLGRDKKYKAYRYSTGINKLRNAGIIPLDFHAHALRREYISRAIEAGLTYATIRKQSGHKSTQAIELYDEGLATAPETRAILDKHEKLIKADQLAGAFEALGLTGDALEKALAHIENREPRSGWRPVFPEPKKT